MVRQYHRRGGWSLTPATIEDADADGFLWVRTCKGELLRVTPSEVE